MTKVSRLWMDYQESGALHALVPMQAAIDERTFITKSGDLFTVLATDGVDDECLHRGVVQQIAHEGEFDAFGVESADEGNGH